MPYEDRLRALISKGYFPKELPAVFTTADFGRHAVAILSEWEKFKVYSKKSTSPQTGGKAKRDCFNYKLSNAEIEIISMPKRGFERRNIHITHPVPQALLSHEVAANWKAIQKWLMRQKFSLDEIRLSNNYDRSIKGINFAIHNSKKSFIEGTSDWIVKTDISRFYPTIYTHSIAWAAYGKSKVKANIKLYDGSLADRIDGLVRACNRNQTIGIPIGPETSRIMAEIISSRIDSEFSAAMPKIAQSFVDRLQDDWFVGVANLEDGEKVLSTISNVYREYGLEINGSKTSIDRIIAASGVYWLSEIGAFLSHRSGPTRGSRLKELLALCLRLQIEYPIEPVLNYTLSILENQVISHSDVEFLESFLLKAAIVSPVTMDRICRLIPNIQYQTKLISRRRICHRFATLIERDFENGNTYEAIWKLYTIRGLKFSLDSKFIADKIESTASSALALILLDMRSKGLCVRKLPEASWVKRITKESVLSDWIWLLAYEGMRNGWLPDPLGVMSTPFFRAMAARDVKFYNSRRNVPPSKKVVLLAKRARQRNAKLAVNFMQNLRGFDNELY